MLILMLKIMMMISMIKIILDIFSARQFTVYEPSYVYCSQALSSSEKNEEYVCEDFTDFAHSASRFWNDLPFDSRVSDSLAEIRRHL